MTAQHSSETARRVLIVANEVVADRPAGVPQAVRRQLLGAEQVRVVAPMLTTRLESWCSAIDRAASSANQRTRAIVSGIELTGQSAIRGTVGDEDPLQAIDDALATFPAQAVAHVIHTPEAQNRRERGLCERLAPASGCRSPRC